eukprot:EC689442.1.p5 GENE.EC689442.1~~EC689442.1.p5  ORF type:complete len:56 (-),score=7.89 EC689442.1:236-403(-)
MRAKIFSVRACVRACIVSAGARQVIEKGWCVLLCVSVLLLVSRQAAGPKPHLCPV